MNRQEVKELMKKPKRAKSQALDRMKMKHTDKNKAGDMSYLGK